MNERFEAMLPMPVSDETAYAIHLLLNQLACDFECCYFGQIHHHSQKLRQAENPSNPWDQKHSDDLPF